MGLMTRDQIKIEEGRLIELCELVCENMIPIEVAAKRANMSVTEFSEEIKIRCFERSQKQKNLIFDFCSKNIEGDI